MSYPGSPKAMHTNEKVRVPDQRVTRVNVGVLVSLWLFLFAAQPKEFFLNELKKLEQRSHRRVELRGKGNM
jgi:hypothetical protein